MITDDRQNILNANFVTFSIKDCTYAIDVSVIIDFYPLKDKIISPLSCNNAIGTIQHRHLKVIVLDPGLFNPNTSSFDFSTLAIIYLKRGAVGIPINNLLGRIDLNHANLSPVSNIPKGSPISNVIQDGNDFYFVIEAEKILGPEQQIEVFTMGIKPRDVFETNFIYNLSAMEYLLIKSKQKVPIHFDLERSQLDRKPKDVYEMLTRAYNHMASTTLEPKKNVIPADVYQLSKDFNTVLDLKITDRDLIEKLVNKRSLEYKEITNSLNREIKPGDVYQVASIICDLGERLSSGLEKTA